LSEKGTDIGEEMDEMELVVHQMAKGHGRMHLNENLQRFKMGAQLYISCCVFHELGSNV